MLRFIRLLLALAVAAGLSSAVAAASSTNAHQHRASRPRLSSAGPFFLAELAAKLQGRWAVAWRTLYPPHQKVAPLPTFVSCEAARPFPAPLQSIRISNVRWAAVSIPGLARTHRGAAITVEVELAAGYGPRDPIVIRPTFHLIPVNGRWTWILSAASYRLYTDGACAQTATVPSATRTETR